MVAAWFSGVVSACTPTYSVYVYNESDRVATVRIASHADAWVVQPMSGGLLFVGDTRGLSVELLDAACLPVQVNPVAQHRNALEVILQDGTIATQTEVGPGDPRVANLGLSRADCVP